MQHFYVNGCCRCCFGFLSSLPRLLCFFLLLLLLLLLWARERSTEKSLPRSAADSDSVGIFAWNWNFVFHDTFFMLLCFNFLFLFISLSLSLLLSTAGGFIWRVRAKVCYNGMHKAYAACATRNSSVACNKASNEAWHEQQRQLKRNFFSERNFNDIGIFTRIRASASLSACVCVRACVCVCVLEILNSTWSAI